MCAGCNPADYGGIIEKITAHHWPGNPGLVLQAVIMSLRLGAIEPILLFIEVTKCTMKQNAVYAAKQLKMAVIARIAGIRATLKIF